MIPVYQKDGTVRYYSENEIDVIIINSDNVSKLSDYNDGVNIYFRDDSVMFVSNATTDGISIEFETKDKTSS